MADRDDTKKDYSPPRIVHTEKVNARAVSCAATDPGACGAGPMQS
jgi:hypothetical protein